MSYAWEKLHMAIHSLAGTGAQRDRLVGAGMNLIRLQAKDFPEELQDSFLDIKGRLNCVPAEGDEGTLAATARSLEELELGALVKDIIGLHDEITRRQKPFI